MQYGIAERAWAIGLLLAAAITGCTGQSAFLRGNAQFTGGYSISLTGGHFFGPGPIVPDTALPDGKLKNVQFDIKTFTGYTPFANDNSKAARLSDGKTKINQNIDAGVLKIGDGSRAVLLVAVAGGGNRGNEYYYLDEQYRFVWRVDLALDPGFPEGIIRMNDFILNTGVIKVSFSEQTSKGIPGGYDQAGSLKSGQYISGRVGDFDQDGYLDGVLVAVPRVPLGSAMLPGSPVGNQRGFKMDVVIAPQLACELTLRSLIHFREPLFDLIENDYIDELNKLLDDMRFRIVAARKNMERALLTSDWKQETIRQRGKALAAELDALNTINATAINFASSHRRAEAADAIPPAVSSALEKFFARAQTLISHVEALNRESGTDLPRPVSVAHSSRLYVEH